MVQVIEEGTIETARASRIHILLHHFVLLKYPAATLAHSTVLSDDPVVDVLWSLGPHLQNPLDLIPRQVLRLRYSLNFLLLDADVIWNPVIHPVTLRFLNYLFVGTEGFLNRWTALVVLALDHVCLVVDFHVREGHRTRHPFSFLSRELPLTPVVIALACLR